MIRLSPLVLLSLALIATGCATEIHAPQAPLISPRAAVPASVTFEVTVPSSTPPDDTVFVAGDFQGWDPGHPDYALDELPDGRWTITLQLEEGDTIQFKFTRGDWGRVEKGNGGAEIPNRQIVVESEAAHGFTVTAWADLGTITGHVETFSAPEFLAGRTCWVYLPPGYAGTQDRFPVLYMHDGQNLFDVRTSFAGEWQVDEACESLISSGEIEPLIVVGIENSDARIVEYTPFPGELGGGGGEAYLTAIRDFLIPAIDSRYRTKPGAEHTYMAGSSLGGLISAYAGYAHSDTWSRVAAVSPSYWWSAGNMIRYAELVGRPSGLWRFYHDMGTKEGGDPNDDDGNGVNDNVDLLREMRDVMLGQGFLLDVDLGHVEDECGTHSEYFWALRMPDILRFLVDPVTTTGIPQ